ncbi:MAG: hemerythrin domain-containing protein [Bryobacteraceae bacterium]|nr:hemerythrin domain-containing protein [Bryobacteraceae bacterium]
MSALTPIEALEAEHRVIQKVVAGMVVLAEKIEAGEDVHVSLLESIVEFLRTFADRCHHGKEEALLFPALQSRGVPAHGCPLGGLTMEHQKGRDMVSELAQAIRTYAGNEPSARAALVKNLRDLATLYPNHIWKEEYLLFPLAVRVLTLEDQQLLAEKFEDVEHELGHEVHERFEKLASKLELEVSGVNSR